MLEASLLTELNLTGEALSTRHWGWGFVMNTETGESILTWVQRVCFHIGTLQILCKLLCKQDVGQLGLPCNRTYTLGGQGDGQTASNIH